MKNPPQDKPVQRTASPHIDAAHKAAVDTVRLKNDMNADKRASFRMADEAKAATTPNSKADYTTAGQALADRLAARSDTLNAARKGKMYAKGS